jgi:hypothetical protein
VRFAELDELRKSIVILTAQDAMAHCAERGGPSTPEQLAKAACILRIDFDLPARVVRAILHGLANQFPSLPFPSDRGARRAFIAARVADAGKIARRHTNLARALDRDAINQLAEEFSASEARKGLDSQAANQLSDQVESCAGL